MLDGIFSRFRAYSAVLFASLMMFAATSGKRLPGLAPVAAYVVEERVTSAVEVLVAAASIKERSFLWFLVCCI